MNKQEAKHQEVKEIVTSRINLIAVQSREMKKAIQEAINEVGREPFEGETGKFETSLWTTITAVQVITELQERFMAGKQEKEMAAAVIYRLIPLIGELATQFELKYDCPVIDDSIVELAEKAGWA